MGQVHNNNRSRVFLSLVSAQYYFSVCLPFLDQHKEYRRILKEKLSLRVKLIRLIHLGLPRSGKTTSQRRLFEEIVDMISANKGQSEPSTGMAEVYQVIVGLIEGGRWSITRDHQKEAGLLNKLFSYADKGAASCDPDIDFNASNEKGASPSMSFQEAMRTKWSDFKGSFKQLFNFTSRGSRLPSEQTKRMIR